MLLRNLGAAVMNITLSLYIMDHIRRTDLARSEPLRLSLSTFSWMTGPALGVWLYVNFGPWGPQLAAIAAAAVLLVLFWYLRLSDNVNALPPGNLEGFSALGNVRRFLAQPRLRLAWLIAFGRSCFWTTFFIYGPLLLVEAGLGKTRGRPHDLRQPGRCCSPPGSPGRFARRYGVRVVIAVRLRALRRGLARRRGWRERPRPMWRSAACCWARLPPPPRWGGRHSLPARGAPP